MCDYKFFTEFHFPVRNLQQFKFIPSASVAIRTHTYLNFLKILTSCQGKNISLFYPSVHVLNPRVCM
jgi:hypothetical protein